MDYFVLRMTEQDKTNLINIMDKATITGLANSKAIVDLAQRIVDAPIEGGSSGTPLGDE